MRIRTLALMLLLAAFQPVCGGEPLLIPQQMQSECEDEEVIIINIKAAAPAGATSSPLRQNALDPFGVAAPVRLTDGQRTTESPRTTENVRRQATSIKPKVKYTTHKHRRKQIPWDTKVHFAWGADAGTSIDMVGNNCSSVDFNAGFGMRRGWINFLGVSAGVQINVTNSVRTYPLALEFRTNFRDRPSLFFLDLRGGMAYSHSLDSKEQYCRYGFAGVGLNLARSINFTSWLMLGYTFRERKETGPDDLVFNTPDIHAVTCRLGVTF